MGVRTVRVNQTISKKAVGEAVCTFWKACLGWNQADVQVFLPEDQIVVSLKGTLPPAEQKFAATSQGRMRMKQIRRTLLDQGLVALCEAIATSIQTTVFITLTTIHVSAKEEIFTLVFGAMGARPLPTKVS